MTIDLRALANFKYRRIRMCIDCAKMCVSWFERKLLVFLKVNDVFCD